MPFQHSLPHPFSTGSIRAHAPAASGVYGISNRREWIYIGQADNIRDKLLDHLSEADSLVSRCAPTGFSFEVCEVPMRTSRYDRLVQEFGPVSNRVSRR